ncbi:MAG: heme-binding protein [Roseomonas mucosa]|uniref:GlcG protein n=1 Tax=Roseomonas mucosa TaxID=207340 RepID=A0A1S8CZV1_9PROT|nr:heme-binding protein [Roseomonas mucosa]MDT8278713.1 heme-binding protein [Roseomonas mucosa]MDT8356784.1 heme-binding protein [Roseomonas mucosa]MDU7522595.1 heme-binding protein [Roseomonas mucosa]ONH81583.1 glcG protein [Roseomonas mucosa]
MPRRTFLAFLAVLPVLTSIVAGAAELPRQPVLNLEAARAVLSAAGAEARKQGWAGAIAVTDAGGALLAMERLDGAGPASAEIAVDKARTAAMFRRPTSAFEDAINGQRPAAITSRFVMMAGGLPLVVDGQVVGAVGVSAETPQHDVTIAEAGRAALSR